MTSIYVTRRIPENGINQLTAKGFTVDVSDKDGVLTKSELVSALRAKPYDGVLCLLTDTIDGEVFDAVPTAKIFSNYAVGFNNIDIPGAKQRGITVTNTPGVLTNTVAEHAFSLILAVAHRIAESDAFTRAGKYQGWGPLLLLGQDMSGKTLGILGAGRIGERVAHHGARGFDMKIVYYDVKQSPEFEAKYGALYMKTPEEVLQAADVVSVHVPLLDSTKHLIDARRLSMMKKNAILVNTSRGPVVDEVALVEALKNKTIAGAGLDVFENEPALAPGLADLPNAVLTPHTASATVETREAMATLAAGALIDHFEGRTPVNVVK
jgi:lactate dehydrogenase-like 2-hydroxyacid dehydrogenase